MTISTRFRKNRMTHSCPPLIRWLAVLAIAMALTACSSRVVRENSESTPKYGATAVVQRGDTLYGIAFRNGIDFRDLAAWNRIGSPYTIYPGQRLLLYPGSSSDRRSAVARSQPSSKPSHSTPPPATRATPSGAKIASNVDWRWPAEGNLVGRYAAGDPTRQGIDIAGKGGSPVRAAGPGVVVYSGNGLVGYGELVIIKHNDAWLSAYGHNRARMVKEGQVVKAGQQIAEMGRSGAERDMLHFEIRYNGKPVDPLRYLPNR